MSTVQSTGSRWREVPGFPHYRVSDLGVIQSKRHRNGSPSKTWRTMKAAQNSAGYRQVRLCGPDRKRWVELHRLVWEVFNGPIPAGHVVRHAENPDPTDCRLANLACGTQADNCKDKGRHGTAQIRDSHPRAILTSEQVGTARRMARQFGGSVTIKELSRRWGVKKATLWSAVYGATWKSLDVPPCTPGQD